MSIVRQETLQFKLGPLYAQRVEQLAADSKVTFDNFSTPGWSSLMHTENTPEHNKNDHQLILDKLNRIRQVDPSEAARSRMRLPDASNGQNVLIYEQQKHLLKASSRRSERPSSAKENCNERQRLRTDLSRPLHRPPTAASLKNSSLSRSSKPAVGQAVHVQGESVVGRFKQISVHEHLYLAGLKQSSKRAMEQILEQQYRRENVTPFHPQISLKSQQLAESKFSRVQERHQVEQQLEEVVRQDARREGGQRASKVEREKNRYGVVEKLFAFLSGGTAAISKESLRTVEESLPLICIRALQKLLERVYAGTSYTWLQFLGELNDKKVVASKEGLISIFEKWQCREDRPTR